MYVEPRNNNLHESAKFYSGNVFGAKSENQKIKLEDLAPENNNSQAKQEIKAFTLEVTGVDNVGSNLFKKRKEANLEKPNL